MSALPPLETASGFSYRDYPSTDPRGGVIIALHGSGADETSMAPLAQAIDPRARVISVRGRIDQAGERRWFLKQTPTAFDQTSIAAEAQAFAGFVRDIVRDSADALFLGYSNGGNLVHATALLHPGIVRQAALLRCMPVLTRAPATDLSGSRFLVVGGRLDETYGPYATRLVRLLRSRGAQAALRTVPAGHLFGPEDAALVGRWRDG